MKARYDFGSILLSCGLALFGFFAWSYAGNFSPLGAIFPKTFSVVLMCCSLGYILLSFCKKGNCKEKNKAEQLWRGLLLFVVLLLWCLLLDRFGFLVPSVLCYVILAILADQMDRPTPGQVARHIMLGIAVSGLFYVSFSQALSVPLPKGLLPF